MLKRILKTLHILGAAGMIGALTAHIILLTVTPPPNDLADYALMRAGIAAIAKWLLLPSLGVVLISGLLAMAAHRPFIYARWVWFKLGLGIVVFEGTLIGVQGPAVRAAEVSTLALSGQIDPGIINELVRREWWSLWVILAVALVNVMLAVWRPSLRRAASS
ncbi:MAG: hypothetical protein AAGF35_06210 [Pseudomonadota bacterium]